MPKLALHLFGAPHVESDGAPVVLHRQKAAALLAYLAVTRQTHSRDQLATLFWPNSDPIHAHDNLRNCLAELHRVLGGEWIAADRLAVSLAASQSLWVDVVHFRSLLTPCGMHLHPAGEICALCLPLLNEAATLYTADFLYGFVLSDSPAFEEWQRLEAESLRRELASMLDRLARSYAALDDLPGALLYAQRRLELDRLHEPAYRTLMQLHVANGDRASALRVYAECLALLQAELGVEPDPATRALRQRLLQM